MKKPPALKVDHHQYSPRLLLKPRSFPPTRLETTCDIICWCLCPPRRRPQWAPTFPRLRSFAACWRPSDSLDLGLINSLFPPVRKEENAFFCLSAHWDPSSGGWGGEKECFLPFLFHNQSYWICSLPPSNHHLSDSNLSRAGRGEEGIPAHD